MTFKDAIEFVRKTMQEDEGARMGYQSNITMRLLDTTILNLTEADEAADEIMNLLFDIPRADLVEESDE